MLDAASALLAPSYALSPTEQLQLVAATEDVPTRDDGADHPVQAKRAPHPHERLGSGGPTFLIWQVVRVSDQEAEARYVVHQIQRMRLAAEGSPPSIGILYRTNAQALPTNSPA